MVHLSTGEEERQGFPSLHLAGNRSTFSSDMKNLDKGLKDSDSDILYLNQRFSYPFYDHTLICIY